VLAGLGWLGSSLLLTPVLANVVQTEPTVIAQAPSNEAIVKQLTGQWQVEGGQDLLGLLMIFTAERKFYLVGFPDSQGNREAYELAYQINTETKPMQMDIWLPDDKRPVKTIFELLPNGRLWLQSDGTNPGTPRPTTFKRPLLLSKITESPALPNKTRIVPPRAATNPDERKATIALRALLRAQQAYYLENNRFAAQIADLGIRLAPEDTAYQFEIVSEGDRTQQVMIVATPQQPSLHSMTGAAMLTATNGDSITVVQICRADRPAAAPPAMPQLVGAQGSNPLLQCPTGSTSLR